jgi:AraC-like DNA-binding protein
MSDTRPRREAQVLRKIYSTPARRELQGYVRAYAQREVECPAGDIVQPCPASLEQILELDFGSPVILEYLDGSSETAPQITIVGPHTYRRVSIRLRAPVESFGIFFQPLGLWQLFRVPLTLMVNQGYGGYDVLGKEIQQLWQQMAEVGSFGERVMLVEQHLLRRAATVRDCSPVLNSALHIFQEHGATRVSQLARGSGLSVRHFERRFLAEIEMSPKLFARITRYQMAMDAKITSPGRSWLHIAQGFGYHDQMHMIKDFQSLSGASPGAIILEIGDMRPSALAAA